MPRKLNVIGRLTNKGARIAGGTRVDRLVRRPGRSQHGDREHCEKYELFHGCEVPFSLLTYDSKLSTILDATVL